MTEDERREEEKAYLAPALQFDEEAHEQLMAEARQMDSVLKGEQVWCSVLMWRACQMTN